MLQAGIEPATSALEGPRATIAPPWRVKVFNQIENKSNMIKGFYSANRPTPNFINFESEWKKNLRPILSINKMANIFVLSFFMSVILTL